MRAADQEGQWDSKFQGEEVGKEVQSWGVGVEQNAFVMDWWICGSRSLPAQLEAQARSLKERQEPKNLGAHHRCAPQIHAQGCNRGPKRKPCESRLDGTGQQSASSALEDVVPGGTSWPKRADKRLEGLTGGGQ